MSAPADPAPAFLTIDEVAAHLQLHPRTVLRMVHDGAIPNKRIGRVWRIPRAAFEKWCQTIDAIPAGTETGRKPDF